MDRGWLWGQVKRLKHLFKSQACIWVFGFQGGKCQETHRLGRKPLNLVCVGISAPNFYISCSLCIRYGNEKTHIPFALRLSFIRESLILGCVCVIQIQCGNFVRLQPGQFRELE